MKLSDLFLRQVMDLPGKPEHNPLTTGWIFEDAQLLDVRLDVLHSAIGILFEIRTSYLPSELDILSLNCGVMMFRKAREMKWAAADPKDRPQVWPVNECRIDVSDTGVEGHPIGSINGMDLLVKAESVEFYAGRLPALPADIPSYVDHVDVTGLVPGWEMDFSPTNVWALGPSGKPKDRTVGVGIAGRASGMS
jgi:hypothetical protein